MKERIKIIIIIICFLLISGCGKKEISYDFSLEPAMKSQENRNETKIVKETKPVEVIGQLKKLPDTEDEKKEITVQYPKPIPLPKDNNKLSPEARKKLRELAKKTSGTETFTIATINKKASRTPMDIPEGWINAITLYEYMPGALYQIYSSPGYITDIMLEPGESLISQSGGDSLRWKTGVTTTGTGKDKRTHIQIKPTHPKIKTNMVINTDRRTYYLELNSTKNKTYMAGVSWEYPEKSFIKFFNFFEKEEAKQKEENAKIKVNNLEELNFNYEIVGKQPWKPLNVFDNGQKTYIEFPEDMNNMEAPVLFVANDDIQLVNYRKKGNFYIVDRVFSIAELRSGEKSRVIIKNKKLLSKEKGNYYRDNDFFKERGEK